MQRTLEEVNEKLAEELFPDMNGWCQGNLLNGTPYPNAPGYNVEVMNQMPGRYSAPVNIVGNPYMINQYTNPRSTYNPVMPYNSAQQYNQTVPYISPAPYTGNRVPIIDPAQLRAESQIISNLRVRMDQNMENSVSFPLHSTTAPQSSSRRRTGSPRRQKFRIDSHSKVLGYHPGNSRLSNSGDRLARQRFASEEEESSSTSETNRKLNRKKVKLQTRGQLEESDSSSSSSSESVEKSSDASLVSHKLQTKRHNVDRQNDAINMGEFEGLCEKFGILQAQDMGAEGTSNRPI